MLFVNHDRRVLRDDLLEEEFVDGSSFFFILSQRKKVKEHTGGVSVDDTSISVVVDKLSEGRDAVLVRVNVIIFLGSRISDDSNKSNKHTFSPFGKGIVRSSLSNHTESESSGLEDGSILFLSLSVEKLEELLGDVHVEL